MFSWLIAVTLFNTMLIVSVDCLFFKFCLGYLMECVNGLGTDYRGTKSQTKTKKTCQRWAGRYPHKPKYAFIIRSLCTITMSPFISFTAHFFNVSAAASHRKNIH